jgi:hypothetical protein
MVTPDKWKRRRPGLTLVEAMLAVSVLALAVAAIGQAVVAGQMQTLAALEENAAVELGEALLDEVLRLPYDDPNGSDSESTRATFDDVDDFDGFGEAAGSLQDAAGTTYPAAYQKFARSVEVDAASVLIAEFGGALPGVNVTVTVSDGGGRTWVLQRFVAEPAS